MWTRIKDWWQRLWKEEYILILTIPGDITTEVDGTQTQGTVDKTFHAKKMLKLSPKIFIFIDLKDQKNEIKFTKPIDYHVIKVW